MPVLLEDYIGRTLRPRRLLTGVIAVFAATALLLAAFGVYGVVGYRVAQRMKEIAIRVALGAPRWRVTGTVLRDTVTYVGLGSPPACRSRSRRQRRFAAICSASSLAMDVTLATACTVVIAAPCSPPICPRAARRAWTRSRRFGWNSH